MDKNDGAASLVRSDALLAEALPIIHEALNWFYPTRRTDCNDACVARAALFDLRDRIKEHVKANEQVRRDSGAPGGNDGH